MGEYALRRLVLYGKLLDPYVQSVPQQCIAQKIDQGGKYLGAVGPALADLAA